MPNQSRSCVGIVHVSSTVPAKMNKTFNIECIVINSMEGWRA